MILFNRSHSGGYSSKKATPPLLPILVLLTFSLNAFLCQSNQNLFQNTNDDEDQYDMMTENDNESSGNGLDDNNNKSYEEELVKTPSKAKNDESVKRPPLQPASGVKNPELEKKSQEAQPKPPLASQQQAVSKTEITQKDYDGPEYDQDQNNEYDDYDGTDAATNNKDSNKLDDGDNEQNSENTIVNNDPQMTPSTTAPNPPVDNSKYTHQSTGSKLLLIITKPGILAGIIGGAIIGVLTAILLIMFIVYRMRKKDEGSYALEETKKPLNSYDYRNCPTREFYA